MIRGVVLAAAMLAAGPGIAQTSNCAAQWNALFDLVGKSTRVERPAPGLFRQTANRGCRTDGLNIPLGEHLSIKASSLSWSGRDLDRFVQEGLPPTALSLTLSGIRLVPQVGDKTFQYLQEIQSRGQSFEVTLSIDWSDADKAISLDNLLISFSQGDFIRLGGRIEGVDLETAESLAESAGQLGVTELNLEVRSRNLFQAYLVLPLGMALLQGHPDPEKRTEELKALGREYIDAAPDAVLSKASKAGLTALLNDMPDPAGTLKITQTATPGIGVARGLTFAMGARAIDDVKDLWALFEGIETQITYDRF